MSIQPDRSKLAPTNIFDAFTTTVTPDFGKFSQNQSAGFSVNYSPSTITATPSGRVPGLTPISVGASLERRGAFMCLFPNRELKNQPPFEAKTYAAGNPPGFTSFRRFTVDYSPTFDTPPTPAVSSPIDGDCAQRTWLKKTFSNGVESYTLQLKTDGSNLWEWKFTTTRTGPYPQYPSGAGGWVLYKTTSDFTQVTTRWEGEDSTTGGKVYYDDVVTLSDEWTNETCKEQTEAMRANGGPDCVLSGGFHSGLSYWNEGSVLDSDVTGLSTYKIQNHSTDKWKVTWREDSYKAAAYYSGAMVQSKIKTELSEDIGLPIMDNYGRYSRDDYKMDSIPWRATSSGWKGAVSLVLVQDFKKYEFGDTDHAYPSYNWSSVAATTFRVKIPDAIGSADAYGIKLSIGKTNSAGVETVTILSLIADSSTGYTLEQDYVYEDLGGASMIRILPIFQIYENGIALDAAVALPKYRLEFKQRVRLAVVGFARLEYYLGGTTTIDDFETRRFATRTITLNWKLDASNPLSEDNPYGACVETISGTAEIVYADSWDLTHGMLKAGAIVSSSSNIGGIDTNPTSIPDFSYTGTPPVFSDEGATAISTYDVPSTDQMFPAFRGVFPTYLGASAKFDELLDSEEKEVVLAAGDDSSEFSLDVDDQGTYKVLTLVNIERLCPDE